MQAVVIHELDDTGDLDAEVSAILADYFEGDVASPTEVGLAKGRAKVIIRDAANDD